MSLRHHIRALGRTVKQLLAGVSLLIGGATYLFFFSILLQTKADSSVSGTGPITEQDAMRLIAAEASSVEKFLGLALIGLLFGAIVAFWGVLAAVLGLRVAGKTVVCGGVGIAVGTIVDGFFDGFGGVAVAVLLPIVAWWFLYGRAARD